MAVDGPGGGCVWLVAAVLGAGVTISKIPSICPSSRSGETDGRSRSLPSRTGLRRDTRALVLGGIEEAIIDDAEAEVDIPERRDAFSDALSEFMPSPRLAANSL